MKNWLLGIGILFFGFSGAECNAWQSDQKANATIESYLQKLGLTAIELTHLEQRLAASAGLPESEVSSILNRLGNRYASELLSSAETDEARALELTKSAIRLFELYPEYQNPGLKVAILHSRYRVANLEFYEWWYDGRPPDRQEPLNDSFRSLTRDMLRQKSQLENRRDSFGVSQDLFGGDASELARLENAVGQLQYLIGWCSFYRAKLEPARSNDWLKICEENFRGFLQIAPNQVLSEFLETWFDPESALTARGWIGLALCKQSQGQVDASRRCFEALEKSTLPQIKNSLFLWKLKSAIFDERLSLALELAKNDEVLKSHSQESENLFWVTAAKGAMASAQSLSAPAREIVQLAMAGLARNRQAKPLGDLILKYNIRLPKDRFLANWIRGYLLLEQSEREGDRSLLIESVDVLQTALLLGDEARDPLDRVTCSFLLGLAKFRLREFEASTKLLSPVVAELKRARHPIAAQAHWYRIQGLVELSKSRPERVNEAFIALDQMEVWFPDSSYRRKIEFEKLKLNLRSMPDREAAERLSRVGEDSANFVEALYALVKRRYSIWLSEFQKGEGEGAEAAFQIFVDEAAKLTALGSVDSARKLKVNLLVLDGRLRKLQNEDSQGMEALQSQLAECLRLADSVRDREPSLYAESRYYHFQIAKRDDPDLARQLAEWIFANASGTRFERPALIYLASSLVIADSGQTPAPPEIAQGIKIYSRLLKLTGGDDRSIKSSTNYRIAMARLASFHFAAGDFSEANRLGEKLVDAFPNNREYVAANARVKMKLQLFDSARSLWRKLVQGVEAGSDVWHEAKLNLAICVGQQDSDQALALIRQTQQLSPEMKPAWQEAFRKLEESLKRRGND